MLLITTSSFIRSPTSLASHHNPTIQTTPSPKYRRVDRLSFFFTAARLQEPHNQLNRHAILESLPPLTSNRITLTTCLKQSIAPTTSKTMQDIAVRVLSALRSVTSTRAGNMCTFPAQLCDIPYGNKFGTQFVRYDYSGHDRTFGQLHLNDQQMYRRVLKLAHQYHSHLLKIADIIGGCSSGSGQGGPPSWDDGGREELVHSRQRLENNPVLEILSSNLWVRLGLLTVLCLGAFIYCLVMMEQQQAEIAGRGTNWWADMSPLTSVMSSGSSSTAPTSITPSTTRVIVGDASGGAFVGLGVQLAEESVPESTARESSTRPRTSESRYFTRQGNVHSSLTFLDWLVGKLLTTSMFSSSL